MNTELTGDDIKKFISNLPNPPKDSILKTHPFLNTTQTIIKCGNNVYIPEDIRNGEIKIIDIPIPDFFDYPLKIKITYDEPSGFICSLRSS